jgi:hypothetical protein
MRRAPARALFGVVTLGSLGLGPGCRVADFEHCANRAIAEGVVDHAWCATEHGAAYCDHCQRSTDRNGCTDVRPSPAECLPTEPPPSGSSSGAEATDTSEPPCSPNGPSEACAAVDPLTPFCREEECVACEDALCAEGVCDPRPERAECVTCRPEAAEACPADAPWCNDELECTNACSRHEDCPASACELVEGTCIPPVGAVALVDRSSEQCVAMVGADWGLEPITYCSLDVALADAPDLAVIRLRDVEGGPWALEPADALMGNRVVVLMADPAGPPVTLLGSATSDPYLLHTIQKTRLYLHRLVLQGSDGNETIGIDCEGSEVLETHVRLHDVEVRGFAAGIRAADCDLGLVRTRIHGSRLVDDPRSGIDPRSGVGIDLRRRSLQLDSSVVARNEGVGVWLESVEDVAIRFSSLLGNGSGLDAPLNVACEGAFDPMGDRGFAASLLLLPAVTGTTMLCTEDAIGLDDRTRTEQQLDDGFEGYDDLEELFDDVTSGRLRDPATNPITALGLVPWEPGEPYLDVDGEMRPRPDRPQVTPGANEP